MGKKVSIIGAGNVGCACANVLATRNVVNVIVLLDIKEGIAEGKAIDLRQGALQLGSNTSIVGTTADYSRTADSDIIVITSGIPRKPGQTREEMLKVNGKILDECVRNAVKYSPNAIFIPITNPVDTLTYHTYRVLQKHNLKVDRHRVLGLGGVLDSARFRYYLEKQIEDFYAVSAGSLFDVFVIGGHSDTTMVPLISQVKLHQLYRDKRTIFDLLHADELQSIVDATKVGGATLTKHLGTSAWQGPGIALARMIEAIIRNRDVIYPCTVPLEGEYGESDICIGVPVVLGTGGWKKVIELNISEDEKKAFKASADAVRTVNAELQ
ncbi:MAG: malate dehydrogenase [Candidatus Peribacteria bacterium]|jgi:malate dehydrogenase|nr:malate dehydrogenase [Candidatus Peribacteria bacterium]